MLLFLSFINFFISEPKLSNLNNTQINDSIVTYAYAFNQLNTDIRNNSINKNEASQAIKDIIIPLRSLCLNSGMFNFDSIWVFPVEGYSTESIGGKNGSGYKPSKYNYLDGNKHSGHAAHDIFIHDKNQDCLDDKTNLPVNVLSVTDGIVVALEFDWDTLSTLRGGKYIWVYDPHLNSLFYYAHNNEVFVSIGQIVKAGDKIATVGRSGYNAFKRRSPSHLHFSQLIIDDEYQPVPVNPYQNLIKAKFR